MEDFEDIKWFWSLVEAKGTSIGEADVEVWSSRLEGGGRKSNGLTLVDWERVIIWGGEYF